MLTAVPPVDPADQGLIDACTETPGWICEQMWEWTGSEAASRAADWFVATPLRVLLIVIVAFLLNRFVRRVVAGMVGRLTTPQQIAAAGIERLGMKAPEVLDSTSARSTERARTLSAVLMGLATAIIWTVAGLLVIGEFGLSLAPLLASAGIAGIALGFGAQSLVRDCITGVFMLIEDQYGVSDVVDLGEASGTVEKVTLRLTTLRAPDGTVWHVPNGAIVRVGNRSQLWSMALLDLAIAYDNDVDRAQQVILDAARTVCEADEYKDQVLEAPTILGVESVGPDGVTIRLTVKTEPGEQWALQRALREGVKAALDDAGIRPPPRGFAGDWPRT